MVMVASVLELVKATSLHKFPIPGKHRDPGLTDLKELIK